jgi:hypothetical protein
VDQRSVAAAMGALCSDVTSHSERVDGTKQSLSRTIWNPGRNLSGFYMYYFFTCTFSAG